MCEQVFEKDKATPEEEIKENEEIPEKKNMKPKIM